MKALTRKQLESCRAASETISNIEFLEKRPEFMAFMGRMRRQADEMAENILHNDSLSGEEREKIRQKRLGILEVLKASADDKKASMSILEGYGQLGD